MNRLSSVGPATHDYFPHDASSDGKSASDGGAISDGSAVQSKLADNWSAAAALSCRDSSQRRDGDRSNPPVAFFSPLHYECGYAYPLIIWLHDDGGSEQELRQLMPHLSVRNYVAAAVRGPAPVAGANRRFRWHNNHRGAVDSVAAVQFAVETAKRRYRIHPQRIFLAGHGAGGTMALRIALQRPQWFAGAISLLGAAPRNDAPLAQLNSARNLPLLLASCLQGTRYSLSQACDDLRLLHSAGFSLALQQYPGDDDGLTTKMLSDVDCWIMRQVCPASIDVAAERRAE